MLNSKALGKNFSLVYTDLLCLNVYLDDTYLNVLKYNQN